VKCKVASGQIHTSDVRVRKLDVFGGKVTRLKGSHDVAFRKVVLRNTVESQVIQLSTSASTRSMARSFVTAATAKQVMDKNVALEKQLAIAAAELELLCSHQALSLQCNVSPTLPVLENADTSGTLCSSLLSNVMTPLSSCTKQMNIKLYNLNGAHYY
jgi:hypothetical protein